MNRALLFLVLMSCGASGPQVGDACAETAKCVGFNPAFTCSSGSCSSSTTARLCSGSGSAFVIGDFPCKGCRTEGAGVHCDDD